MKIKRNSWHFRLYAHMRSPYERDPILGQSKFFGWVLFPLTMVRLFRPIPADVREDIEYLAPRSLCGYFWLNVLLLLLNVILWPLSFILVAVCVAPYAVILAVVLGIVGIYRGIESLIWKRKQAKRAKAQAKGLPEPEPSIVLEFMKAKKRRVCPLLTYED